MKSGPNLFLNPGFEIPGAGPPDNNIANWLAYTGAGGTIEQDSIIKQTGLYSAKITPRASPVGQAFISQRFTLDTSKQYQLTIYHKDNADGGLVRRFDLRTITASFFLKEDGTWQNGFYPINLIRSTQWAKTQILFTPHPPDTLYEIYPYTTTTSGIAWFDDFSLCELIPGSPPYLTLTGIGR